MNISKVQFQKAMILIEATVKDVAEEVDLSLTDLELFLVKGGELKTVFSVSEIMAIRSFFENKDIVFLENGEVDMAKCCDFSELCGRVYDCT